MCEAPQYEEAKIPSSKDFEISIPRDQNERTYRPEYIVIDAVEWYERDGARWIDNTVRRLEQ
jgi:hypothetical protein